MGQCIVRYEFSHVWGLVEMRASSKALILLYYNMFLMTNSSVGSVGISAQPWQTISCGAVQTSAFDGLLPY